MMLNDREMANFPLMAKIIRVGEPGIVKDTFFKFFLGTRFRNTGVGYTETPL